MSTRRTPIRLAAAAVAVVLSGLLAATAGTRPAASATYPVQQIEGSGSTWAENAVNQWIGNVQSSEGVNVTFNGDGSAAGRTDFAQGTVDFAVSDIGYQGSKYGGSDSSARPYAYLPITAGGTSFPYNIVVGGKRITNLRLSGKVLAEIFTNQITNWDNPAITANNNGHALPNLAIITVVPSEGSGTTAMFTQYLSYEFSSLWSSFNSGSSAWTEYWPRQGSNQVSQDGSSQVMNYIESAAANGAIGFDEYSYPLAAEFPVVQMENAAGYYVLPSEYNDAVALTKAMINEDKSSPDYLLQNLDNVYGYTDPRTYPLSSYSYTIMPTSATDEVMKKSGNPAFPAKAQALAQFLDFSICQGQESIGAIGYSALPVNLVEAGFSQIEKIKTAAPAIGISALNINTCHNPTFVAGNPNENYLAQIAPQPPKCDENGYGPCVGDLNANGNGGQGSTTASGTGKPPTSASTGTGTSGSGGSSGTGGAGSSGSGGKGVVNPVTGQTTAAGADSAGTGSASATASVLPAGQGSDLGIVLAVLAVVLLLAALAAPPVLARYWSTRVGRRP
jgi:phosphate transport system substrate-binding protein